MSRDPWQSPDWHVTVPAGMLPPYRHDPAWHWPRDLRQFAVTTVFVVLCGPVVGLVWSAMGPKLPLARALSGSAAAYRTQIGADFHFLLLGATAGLVCAAIAVALGYDGPGVLLGLVVGGLGGAVLADLVGYVASENGTLDGLRRLGVGLSLLDKYDIDPFFKVRALPVLVAWPMAALVLHTLAVAVRHRPR